MTFDHNTEIYNGEDIINRIEVIHLNQSTLICIEMLILSYAGGLAYSHKPFISFENNKKASLTGIIKNNIS